MTQHFKIEKGVPLDGRAKRRWPFHEMEVGDSFVMPADAAQVGGNSAHGYGKVHGKTFTVRKQPDGTYRCWRIA